MNNLNEHGLQTLWTKIKSTFQPKDADLTAIAGLTGTSGFLKKTAANTWSLDTTTYAASSHNHNSSYAALSHTHTKSQITDFPSSLPASDVYSWAKQSSKPGYSFSEISSRGEALLDWGGRSLAGQVSPIGMALSNEHSANRLAFINGASLTVEYSSNGGSTWTDYGYSASQKSQFCTQSLSIPIGRSTGSTSYSTSSRTRITLTAQNGTTGYVYTDPKKMLINVSSSGGLQVLVEYRTGTNYQNSGAWTTFGTYTLSGWSGWNDIPLILGTLGGGTTQTGNYWQLRLTVIVTSYNSSYPTTCSIQAIRIYGSNCWTATSTMGSTGHLYSFDMSQNATFPAKVTAASFSGPLTGNVTGNCSGSSGSCTGNAATATTATNYSSSGGIATALAGKQNAITSSNKLSYSLISGTPSSLPANGGTATNARYLLNEAGDQYLTYDPIHQFICDFYSHGNDTSNPHSVTKSQVGLGNVENKSSATIRGELTKANVTTALGYTPPTENTWRPIGTGASDAAAGNHTHSYLPLSGGALTGSFSLKETCNILLRPNLSSYTSGIGYDTSGNECVAIWAKNSVTRLRWHAGTDMSSLTSGKMMGITPDFEISKATGTAIGYIAGNVIVHSGNIASYFVNNAGAAFVLVDGNGAGDNVGSATQPVYFASGAPQACSYTLGKSVPSNAIFTDTTYSAGTGLTLSGTSFSVKYGTAAGTACQGNDSRLANTCYVLTSLTTNTSVFDAARAAYVAGRPVFYNDGTYFYPCTGGTSSQMLFEINSGNTTALAKKGILWNRGSNPTVGSWVFALTGTDSGWQTITNTYVQYRKVGKIVYLSGYFIAPDNQSSNVVQLPSGYRPSQISYYGVATIGNSGPGFAEVCIDTSGYIGCQTTSAPGQIYITGLSFFTA